jgi:hypothetical protein
VQVGGDLGALLRADPLRALGGEAADEPQPPRREDQHDHDDHDDDGEDHVARRAERVVEPQEHEAGRDDERGAERGGAERGRGQPQRADGVHRPAGARRGRGRRRALDGGRGRALAPDDRGADAGQQQRPGDRVAEPQAPLAQDEQKAEQQHAAARPDQPRVAAPGEPHDRRARAAVLGDQQPGDHVHQ